LVFKDLARRVQQFPNCRVANLVQDSGPTALGKDEVPRSQYAEVLGEGRLLSLKAGTKLRYAQGSIAQRIEDPDPQRIGEYFKELGLEIIAHDRIIGAFEPDPLTLGI